MAGGLSIRSTGEPILVTIDKKLKMSKAEALLIASLQRTRILERLDKGVDVDGKKFVEYSTAPFYHTVRTAGRGAARAAHLVRATKRLYNRLTTKQERNKSGAPRISRTGKSIFFPGGYRQYKEWLGRRPGLVDLTESAKMRQAIQMKATQDATSTGVRMGVYGDELGTRAAAHNTGSGVPKRHWFDVSRRDIREMRQDILDIKQ